MTNIARPVGQGFGDESHFEGLNEVFAIDYLEGRMAKNRLPDGGIWTAFFRYCATAPSNEGSILRGEIGEFSWLSEIGSDGRYIMRRIVFESKHGDKLIAAFYPAFYPASYKANGKGVSLRFSVHASNDKMITMSRLYKDAIFA